jgi:Ca-activated chloride channel family protein
VNRLTAVKQVLDDFLARRQGDRVGVVVFGSAPFALVPFTTDLKLARQLAGEMQVGMAGPLTVVGDAIGLGNNLFVKSTVPAKTMIALTDGNDTASSVPPDEAAQVAHDKGIVIHTVAVGDPAAAGEEKLDEAALKQVADLTGGGYYRALDHEQLAGIYARLDAVETRCGRRLAPMSDEAVRALWLKRVQTHPADFLRARFGYQLQATDSGQAQDTEKAAP